MLALIDAACQCAHAQKMLATYATLTTAAAQRAAQAAFDRCSKDGLHRDRCGRRPRRSAARRHARQSRRRAHGETAIGKAATAVSFRVDTTELAAQTQAGTAAKRHPLAAERRRHRGRHLVQAKGALVGGIGVSGAPGGDADEMCAKAGIAAISDALELE